MKKIRTYIITGLLLLLPAFVTAYILILVLRFSDRLLGSLFGDLPGRQILGLIAFLLLLFILGLLAANYFGKRSIKWMERLLSRIPVLGSIYSTTRQFTEALSSPDRGFFRQVVLVQYPRAGLYSMGFLTGEAPQICNSLTGCELVSVFVPTIPNPTTGFLIHLPVQEVITLPLSIDEGIKFIISAGVVKPPEGENPAIEKPEEPKTKDCLATDYAD